MQWQKDLDIAISKYGSYKEIPKDEKERLVKHYRSSEIQKVLFDSSNTKCAFCENSPTESGHIEVEHFKPKSLYPEFTFSWDNLLPSCKKCNNSKLTHDTVNEPIINPYADDPSQYFHYQDIQIKPINDNVIGERTITICDLNNARLMIPRGQLLSALHTFSKGISDALVDYEECTTDRTRINRIRKISQSIDTIEELIKPERTYSAYSKHYLDNCIPYRKAKKLIEEFME